jgi:hypothetical protein
LGGWRAGATDIDEIEIACSNDDTQSPGSLSAKFSLGGTGSVAGFGCIEAHEPDVGLLMINFDGIAVYYSDVAGVDWFGLCAGQKNGYCAE